MLKFVFVKPPTEVRRILREFEQAVQEILHPHQQMKLHVYDTQFHMKRDNSLDFSSTSSCFQLIGPDAMSTPQMLNILTNEKVREKLSKVYEDYHVATVEPCSQKHLLKAETTLTQLWVLIIACLIGLGGFVASCTLCCLHSKYNKAIKKKVHQHRKPILQPSQSYISGLNSPRMYAEPVYTTTR